MAKIRKKIANKKGKNSKRVTRQTTKAAAIAKATTVYPPKNANKQSKEFERCREWLVAQKKLKTKFIPVDDIDDEIPGTSYQPIGATQSSSDSEPKPALAKTKDLKDNAVTFKINPACEWAKCSAKLKDYVQLQEHVTEHIATVTPTEDEDNQYECLWDLCNYSTDDHKLFRIHVHYHIYHTHLKTTGETLLMKKKLPPCLIDSRRRNYIPDILHEYLCQWQGCTRKYEKVYEFFDHLRQHCRFDWSLEQKHRRNIANVRQMKCGWVACSKVFGTLVPYVDHVQNHSQEKLFACPNCGSTFKSYNKFYKHYQRQSETKPYQCSQCFKYYATEELLCTHKNSHVNCHKCSLCDMTCASQSALAQHVRYRHVAEKPFKCSLCSYASKSKSDLEKHIMIKHEKALHECEEFGCNFRTESYTLMRRHDHNVHGLGPNVYCCHCCDKRFQQGRHLSNHLIKKHNLQLPSGHSRFIYHQQIDGHFRLQTMRMESLEVTQQIMKPDTKRSGTRLQTDNVEIAIAGMTQNEDGISFQLEMQVNDAYDDDEDDDEDSEEEDDDSSVEDVNVDNDMPEVSMADALDDSSIKNIDNFTVMKRYIQSNKKIGNILIEMKEVDKDGNVTISKLIKADEFRIKKDRIEHGQSCP